MTTYILNVHVCKI